MVGAWGIFNDSICSRSTFSSATCFVGLENSIFKTCSTQLGIYTVCSDVWYDVIICWSDVCHDVCGRRLTDSFDDWLLFTVFVRSNFLDVWMFPQKEGKGVWTVWWASSLNWLWWPFLILTPDTPLC